MSSHEITAFEGPVAASFDGYGDTVRGWIRYELVRQNLAKIVGAQLLPGNDYERIADTESLRIADIGGGTARDAVWLARLGHEVTIVEPGEKQRKIAWHRIAQQVDVDALSERIRIVPGTVEELLEQEGERSFDLTLSHGVAMYLDEPSVFIRNLVRLTKHEGYVSLLEKGRAGALQALRRDSKDKAAAELERTHRFVNNMDRDVWAFSHEELETYLDDAGAWLERWWGVRSLITDSDYRKVSEVEPEELDDLLNREAAAGCDDTERQNGQMLHFIAEA